LDRSKSSYDLYRTLKELLAQCQNLGEPAQGYLKKIVLERLTIHSLSRLRFSRIFAVSPWEEE
jgi:hypothetical protein